MELPFFTTTASSSSTTTKAEALRWLVIAEKLLAGRDLVGSKSFATRARESDPSLVYADQIIAVADTLIAGDKRINNNQPDWYSILQLPGHRTHDSELIASQYRKLVLLLNPQKNKLSYADQAFNLVMSAWSVLSNPSRKAMYDNEFMAHLAVNSPSGVGGGFNPIFSGGASREQVNYHHQQPFELNFQVMPQPQHHHHQPPPQPAQQGMVTGQVNEMQQLLGGMSREHVNLQLPEQVPHSIPPQLNLSREQVWQSQPQAPPPPQPQFQQQPFQPQAQGLHKGQQPQHLPQPMQYQPQHQSQPQPQPQPQQQRKEQHWTDGNARENFSGSVGGTNNAHIGSAQNENNMNRNVEGGENKEEEARVNQSSIDDESSFWTACPYCYYMFQYPNDYVECIFKCQNKKCRKAFHGEAIPSPPPIVEGEESYFCCWATIPLGVSMNVLDRNAGVNGKWTPFSPVFNGPAGTGAGVGNYGSSGNVNYFGGWNANNNVQQQSRGGGYTGGRTISAPRKTYVEDDVLEYSEPSDESDDDWRNFGKKRTGRIKTRHVKRKGAVMSSGRQLRKTQVDSGKNVNGVGNDTLSGGVVLQQCGAEIPNVPDTESIKEGAAESVKKGVTESVKKEVAELGKKGTLTAPRRQSARKAKELGRLDLNVEFSNEAEEHVGSRVRASQGNASGRRMEDIIIEGGGFFEGLDDFLTSLPILNVVGDTKVKAA